MIGFIKRRWLLVVIATLVVVGAGMWMNSRSTALKGKPFTVKKIDLIDALSFSGTVDATDKAVAQFQAAGKIAYVKVKEGDKVKKGQVIAGLDMGDLDQAVTDTYYKYLAADANAKQVEDDVKDHDKDESFAQKNERVAAQTARDIAYDNWLAALRNRSNATLRSPIDGFVYHASPVVPGMFFYLPSAAEFEIVNPATIYFSASADQTDVVKLQVGHEADITLDSYPDKPLKTTVTQIAFSPKTDETGTVYEIRLTLDQNQTDYDYRLGMTGDVNYVVSENKDVIAIPSRLVKTTDGVSSVMKKTGERVVKTEVKIGQVVEGQTEITSGLNEGDVIYDQTQ